MSVPILTERHEGYALVTLNRPERRNALGTALMAALETTLKDLSAEDGVKAIVLTGAPPAFCAGSDLKELGGLSIAAMTEHEAETARIARSIAHLPVPVIAAVEGYALGGGFILATSCDVVVSSESAHWAMPEVKNGWLPPWGLQTLLARTGPVKARLITWGAIDMDGKEAHRLGVADIIAADGNALKTAQSVASRLAALPPDAVAATKRFFAPMAVAVAETLDAESARLFAGNCESDEAKAVLTKFGAPS